MSQPLGKLEHIGARSGHHLLSLRGRGRASLRPEVPRRVRSMKFGAGLRPPTRRPGVHLLFRACLLMSCSGRDVLSPRAQPFGPALRPGHFALGITPETSGRLDRPT
jgi:hypothetical protein